jgi:hypothetical protein
VSSGADKQRLREQIWQRIAAEPEVRTAVPPAGRIPGFQQAEQAAQRLAQLEEWRAPRALETNPDTPQLPVPKHFRVDYGVAPTRVIRCPRGPRPQGLSWGELDSEKIAAIPALAARRAASEQ